MSNATKVLLLLTAFIAFAIGAAVKLKGSHIEQNSIDATGVLAAKLLTAEGESRTIDQYTKQLTMLNFWASWCSPCRREMPLFENVYREHQDQGFTIIGVALEAPETSQPFLDSMDISYPILYAEKTGFDLMELAGNQKGGLPYTVLLNSAGEVIDSQIGEIHEPDLRAWLSSHLAQSN